MNSAALDTAHGSNRDRLIAQARRLFAQCGYADVSVDEVAAAAGLTKGAVYYQFKDKADLFKAACLAVMDDVARHVDRNGRGLNLPKLALLANGAGRLFDAYESEEAHRLLLIDGPAVMGFAEWTAMMEPVGVCLVENAMRHYVDAGLVKPHQSKILSQLLFGAFIQGALRMATAPDRAAAAREVREGADIILQAFLKGLTANS
ncbi:TetR/AcrR family transcriptional regulator [Phenylobacterium sp.]|uniref:TetR/AcrR family transcriptional regulator n=1 Tax=Phenylobacterium sp. TaxID=1871053 RepID=UPI0035ADCCDE